MIRDPAVCVRGYGVIQPRVSTTPASSGTSIFAKRVYAGQTGIDPYTTARLRRLPRSLPEGDVYVGKAIYEVDAFTATSALEGRIP